MKVDIFQPTDDQTPLIALIAANTIPLFGVFIFGWDVFDILLIYWLESGVIGFYNILKMIKANKTIGALLSVFYGSLWNVHVWSSCFYSSIFSS